MRRQQFQWIALVGAMAALGSVQAQAAGLALDVTGEFGPTTTLARSPFGGDTPYSFHAVFDPTNEVFHMPGAGIFPITQLTLTIAGHGTLAGIPNIDLNAVVLDPNYHLGVYAAGLVDHTATSFFLHAYSAVSPPFRPEAPTPATFLGYLKTESVFPYVIPLAGGVGDLAIRDFGDAVPTASLVAVPEPSSLLGGLCGLALLAGGTLWELRARTGSGVTRGKKGQSDYRQLSQSAGRETA